MSKLYAAAILDVFAVLLCLMCIPVVLDLSQGRVPFTKRRLHFSSEGGSFGGPQQSFKRRHQSRAVSPSRHHQGSNLKKIATYLIEVTGLKSGGGSNKHRARANPLGYNSNNYNSSDSSALEGFDSFNAMWWDNSNLPPTHNHNNNTHHWKRNEPKTHYWLNIG